MDYLFVSDVAKQWGVSERWVQRLILQGRVNGATQQGRRWVIPEGSPKPVDERAYRYLQIPKAHRIQFLRIDTLKAELRRRRPLSVDEVNRIRQEFAIEYTYDSNAIEGSTLTLKETAYILDGITIGEKPLREHLEAIGHRDAYRFIEDLAISSPQDPITPNTIKDIHSLVLVDRPESRGKYREVAVRILGTTHRPPMPILVPELVEKLLLDSADDMRHPIERVAWFHLEFESIHPFIDGNGRTGRLLLNLMLLQTGYLPINIKYVDRRRYYDCFEAWDKLHDLDPMTTLIADYTEQRLNDWLTLLS